MYSQLLNFIQGELSGSGQLHGYRMMWSRCKEYGIKMKDASLISITLFGSSQGSFRRMRSQGYHALGPKFIWHIDGYDIGLCINECICEFSHKIISDH